MQQVHLIAIGGSAMHNLALALHEKGLKVTGSDDEINEPSRSRLQKAGLLPHEIGWFPEKITPGLDAVIVGMHARADNPELLKAHELSLRVYSYPEYIYEATRTKTRIVVGGSHGKTTITAMILHVMKAQNIETDYLVGAQLAGFDTMVRLSESAKYAVIEGDEYLASPIDRRPKFHLYHPHIAILSGIAWDHVNVFPTFENYVSQFETFISLIDPEGTLVYCEADPELRRICEDAAGPKHKIGYGVPPHETEDGVTALVVHDIRVPLQVFGDHNLMNLNGARLVCNSIGITDAAFYESIQTFRGAARRLELVTAAGSFSFYKDFAHSPSKLKATVDAVRKQFPARRLVACMELHTFSSLNESFLEQYAGAMDHADESLVYFNPHTIAHKKLPAITKEQVQKAFMRDDLHVFTESADVVNYLKLRDWRNAVLLMMTSGNFDGVDFAALGSELMHP